MMKRFSAYCALVFFAINLGNIANAQCTSAIPGLPAGANIPCNNTIPGPITPVGSYDPNAAASPNANKNTSDFCDADFMNQIYARSYLEASREIMTAEVLIPKPDSVLEYSCFDQRVRDTARIAGPLFSSSRFFTNGGGGVHGTIANPLGPNITINVFMGTTKLERSLNDVVMASLNNFVNTNNFTHTFLGGTQSTADDTVAADIATAGSTCTHMQDVWLLAKCEDVISPPFFTTFRDYNDSSGNPLTTNIATTDIRDAPLTGLPTCGNSLLTPELVQIANNDAGAYAYKDDVVTYLNFLNTTSAGSCENPPIPTGLRVIQKEFNYPTGAPPTLTNQLGFEDYVCPNPGCFYRQATRQCEPTP